MGSFELGYFFLLVCEFIGTCCVRKDGVEELVAVAVAFANVDIGRVQIGCICGRAAFSLKQTNLVRRRSQRKSRT